MQYRTIAAGVLAASAVVLAAPTAAQAKESVTIDMRGYDASPIRTGDAIGVDGPAWGTPFTGTTAGTVIASDGTLPPAGTCEPATVSLRLDIGAGESLTFMPTGELCADQWGGLTLNAYYDKDDVGYAGDQHKKATGEGLIALRVDPFLGTIWTVSGSLRW